MSSTARRLFAISIAARLPLPMLSIGLLVHVQHLTGSFAAAGLVSAIFAVALGAGGPLLARIADRRGQTPVLIGGALVAGSALAAIAALPAGAPAAALVAPATVLGLSVPPVGACWRALLPTIAGPSAYAADATAVELTFVAGPPLVLLAGELWSTGVALAGAGVVLVVATAAFAAQPASRDWRPQGERPRGGSLQSGGMRVLVLILLAVGVVFGATEVGVTAAATGAAGPLLGIWGAGSLIGGLVAARSGAALPLVLAALAAGHLALAFATGSELALGIVIAFAGSTIAPTYAIVYAMVERVAPAGTLTEAFAWLATAAAIGAAVGSALAGAVADAAGPAPVFVLAGVAGAAAVVIAAGTTLARPCDAPAT
jgi:predicted MFS family arabinose efflux permease